MKTFLKANADPSELAIYRILNIIAEQYNDRFSQLVLPQALKIDTKNQTLTLPHYEGETFNERWHESNGGLPMGLDLAQEIPLIIQDLSLINTSLMLEDEQLTAIPKFTFEYEEANKYYGAVAETLNQAGFITEQELRLIIEALHYQQTSELIISNGDFYPRNFIKQPNGKIVLIDWQAWGENTSPFFIVDHPENVAAVQFAHMWGNKVWQKRYVAELNNLFDFDPASFRKGVVIKSLGLANFWLNKEKDKSLVAAQVELLRDAMATD